MGIPTPAEDNAPQDPKGFTCGGGKFSGISGTDRDLDLRSHYVAQLDYSVHMLRHFGPSLSEPDSGGLS
jgi:hypothetical protein